MKLMKSDIGKNTVLTPFDDDRTNGSRSEREILKCSIEEIKKFTFKMIFPYITNLYKPLVFYSNIF